MNELYDIIDAFFAPGILIGVATCLLFFHIPPKAALRGLRIARYALGAAYLLYAACIIMEHHLVSDDIGEAIARPIIVVVASFQACIFTGTLITLTHLNYVTQRKAALELAPVVIASALLFTTILGGVIGGKPLPNGRSGDSWFSMRCS